MLTINWLQEGIKLIPHEAIILAFSFTRRTLYVKEQEKLIGSMDKFK